MSKNVMVKNGTKYPMTWIHEYLAGYETKLRGFVKVYKEKGTYYDTIVVNEL